LEVHLSVDVGTGLWEVWEYGIELIERLLGIATTVHPKLHTLHEIGTTSTAS
jgi:hypothetical protein